MNTMPLADASEVVVMCQVKQIILHWCKNVRVVKINAISIRRCNIHNLIKVRVSNKNVVETIAKSQPALNLALRSVEDTGPPTFLTQRLTTTPAEPGI